MSYRVYSSPIATIANGQTTSGEVDTRGLHVIGIQFPAAFTGASISLQRATNSGGTFAAVRDINNAGAFTVPATAGAYVPLDPVVTLGLQYVKIVSASQEGDQRLVELVCVPVVR